MQLRSVTSTGLPAKTACSQLLAVSTKRASDKGPDHGFPILSGPEVKRVKAGSVERRKAEMQALGQEVAERSCLHRSREVLSTCVQNIPFINFRPRAKRTKLLMSGRFVALPLGAFCAASKPPA